MAAKRMVSVAQPSGEPSIRRRFQNTNLGGNNNKWWLVEAWPIPGGSVLYVKVSYGRVGTTGQVDTRLERQAYIDRKIAEKLAKGYHEVSLAAAAPGGASAPLALVHNDAVGRLLAQVFKEAGEAIASFLSTTVDRLSPQQIATGRTMLAQAQRVWPAASAPSASASDKAAVIGVVQAYFNAIPTQLPHKIDAWEVARAFCMDFSGTEDRLNQLEAALATLGASTGATTQQRALNIGIVALDPRSDAYGRLAAYVTNTLSHGYRVQISAIYEVEIPQERQAYTANLVGAGHRDLLFHGTAAGNVRHILKSGLIVPTTASNGRAFGHGIYFANKSSKSINYTSARHGDRMLFVNEVALGRMHIPRSADEVSNARRAPNGADSVWGKTGQTARLQYDEFIVYTQPQQTLRYIIQFR